MIFDFYPWKMDIDIKATEQLYERKDYAKDRNANQTMLEAMSEKQKNFFVSVGVDILKAKVTEKVYNIPSDGELSGGKIYSRTLDFLMCGKFLSIPDYQEEIYSDEDIFGMNFPDSLQVISMPEEQKIPVFDIDGWGCVFKHPLFRFGEEDVTQWDCGYIAGSILLMKDL
ncbi:hypothetical protein [Lactonifactor longoviformis]|uniref:hypothetical protein n=1 Tax=Lactonifactor longoviformis TaxID=341220 RepID=UPI0036F2ECA1